MKSLVLSLIVLSGLSVHAEISSFVGNYKLTGTFTDSSEACYQDLKIGIQKNSVDKSDLCLDMSPSNPGMGWSPVFKICYVNKGKKKSETSTGLIYGGRVRHEREATYDQSHKLIIYEFSESGRDTTKNLVYLHTPRDRVLYYYGKTTKGSGFYKEETIRHCQYEIVE